MSGSGRDGAPGRTSRLTSIIQSTALELAKHIARDSLIDHIRRIIAAIPPDAHLMIMHFGLRQLFRDMESAQNAVLRDGVRAQMAGDEVAPDARPKSVGIGAKQPSKEKMEYELMK